MWRVAGVDEAGRGPLVGPVVAAAVILDPAKLILGLRDSKTLSARQRERLAVEIRRDALAWGIGAASAQEIDAINILQATFLAMRRAIVALTLRPDHIQVDGNQGFLIDENISVEPIVRGDQKVPAIAAASILAKTTRDAYLIKLDKQYPGYGFAQHKGYPTPQHLAALERLGICSEHRLSFAPVRLVAEK